MLHSPQLSRRLIANYAITDALQRRHDGLVRNASIDQSRRVFTSVNEKEESGRKKKQKNDACVKNTTAISTHPLVSRHKQSSSIPKLNTRNVWNVVSEIRNESEQIRDTANGSTDGGLLLHRTAESSRFNDWDSTVTVCWDLIEKEIVGLSLDC